MGFLKCQLRWVPIGLDLRVWACAVAKPCAEKIRLVTHELFEARPVGHRASPDVVLKGFGRCNAPGKCSVQLVSLFQPVLVAWPRTLRETVRR